VVIDAIFMNGIVLKVVVLVIPRVL
jgi:hypothetical protein